MDKAKGGIVLRGHLEMLVENIFVSFCCFCCPSSVRPSSWRSYFVVLKNNTLLIYQTEQDVSPLQSVVLSGSAVVLPEYPKVSKPHCLEIVTPRRSVFLAAASAQELQHWSISVQRAALSEDKSEKRVGYSFSSSRSALLNNDNANK